MRGLSGVLFAAVRDDLDWIAKRCREVISQHVAACSVTESGTLEAEIALQIECVLTSIRGCDGDGLGQDRNVDSTELALVAAARVRQGLLVDDMLCSAISVNYAYQRSAER